MLTKTIKLYENREDVTLTTYVLDDSAELLCSKKRPAVLVCPGGGYMRCSDREAEPVALRFAAMGYHAFVLRYSTYFGNAPGFTMKTDGDDVNPNSVTPGPMRDIGKAFLTIGQNADQWLVDTDRIAVCGFSAGAHNCAMYSVYWSSPEIAGFFGGDLKALRPAACILGYTLSDYNLMTKPTGIPFADQLMESSSLALMGVRKPTQEMIDKVSPALLVNADTPPTFLWSTAEDDLVPVENTTRMATALAAKKIPFEAHVFEGGPHGLSLADQSTAASKLELNAQAAMWIPLVEGWLKRRFALPLLERPFWMELEGM